jgi:UDPglucose 6-dehydrogenase
MVAAALPDGLEGATIACWGLAFKANTDDVRESPALAVIHRLIGRGATVVAHDPIAHVNGVAGLRQVDTALEAVSNADALLVLTEWPEFGDHEPGAALQAMRGSVVVDTRNILDHAAWVNAGAEVTVLGRGK